MEIKRGEANKTDRRELSQVVWTISEPDQIELSQSCAASNTVLRFKG
jgi:hypothetical protein